MLVIVLLREHNQQTVRMGCLVTLLRLLDVVPGVRVVFVHSLVRDGMLHINRNEPEEPVFVLRPEAEVTDVSKLIEPRHLPSATNPPYLVKGVSSLRFCDDGMGTVKEEDWYLLALQSRDLCTLDNDMLNNRMRVRTDVLLATTVDFTFEGDFGQRNLLRIR